MLTHRNLVSNFLACSELFNIGPDDIALSFLPLSHVFPSDSPTISSCTRASPSST